MDKMEIAELFRKHLLTGPVLPAQENHPDRIVPSTYVGHHDSGQPFVLFRGGVRMCDLGLFLAHEGQEPLATIVYYKGYRASREDIESYVRLDHALDGLLMAALRRNSPPGTYGHVIWVRMGIMRRALKLEGS
jgi:hypothetical protein